MLNAPSTPAIVSDGDLASNVVSFARHLRARNLSPKTRRAYLDGLTRLAAFLTDRSLRVLDLADPETRAAVLAFNGARVTALYESEHSRPYDQG